MPKRRNGERAQARSSGLVPNLAPAARWRRAVTGVVAFSRVSITSLALFRFFAFLAVACLMRVHVARGGAHHVFVVQGL